MTVLLLGKTGQIGFELYRTLSAITSVEAPDRKALNLFDHEALNRYLAAIKPNLIVNAAAWTGVDLAERHRSDAERLNADLPKQLADYAMANSARIVHFSSDYVYPGYGSTPWSETSPVGPLNHYGKTKLQGDQAIMESGAHHLIFRTSWVYSARGNNFMKTMLSLAKSKSEVSIVADQVGAPTPARLIAQLTTLALVGKIDTGLYHIAPRGETSWHGFAEKIFELSSTPVKANPIPTSDYPTPAERPLNSRMHVTKLEQALGISLPDWQSQLSLTLEEYLEQAK